VKALYPLKVLVVCNQDIGWSKDLAEYWADEHDLQTVQYIELPMGTDCVNASVASGSWFRRPTMQAICDELLLPIGAAANAMDANAVFMGPATPPFLRADDVSGSLNGALAPLMQLIRGLHRVMTDGIPAPTNAVSSGFWWEYGWPAGNPFRFPYGGGLYGDTQDNTLQPAYGLFGTAAGRPARIRTRRGHLGYTEAENAQRIDLPEMVRMVSDPVLFGRIGTYAWQRDPTVAAFMGNETEERTEAIIDMAVANIGTISDHKDKPVWIGVHNRTSFMTAELCLACVEMLERAGFTDVNILTRGLSSTAIQIMQDYGWSADMLYTGLTEGNDCFMHFGYALTNGRPGDTANKGTAYDNLFDFLPGALSIGFTSQMIFHGLRASRLGGVGGWGSRHEPGAQEHVSESLYALLHGATLSELAVITDRFGTASQKAGGLVVGDPLYAPFGNELNEGRIEWWAPGGVGPDEVALLPDDPTDPTDPLPGGTSWQFTGAINAPGIRYRSRSASANRTARRPVNRK